ncbi:alpha/beta hydrolase [Nocardiopsis sp. RSe5-2]|uniref:Alpha/beta hydrolase n=1 Tax=Nocardiopsis endophytica TaxID=3018445 RepID=A0ABT4TZM1_9ACTN|nr:alpha/beta hydrolase [Nocardiopsis endophytica]MDA2810136.1 alpha/beta hydrolase [Nocardiopsis endophytica]
MSDSRAPVPESQVPAPVPFDPEIVGPLREARAATPPLETLADVPAFRAAQGAFDAMVSDEVLRRDGAFDVEERTVPGPASAPDVRLLVCRPTSASGPVPALYYTHGGGMVVGDHRLGMPEVLSWAEEVGFAVVSVDYRLAPEHPHPAPVEDGYAGLLWTAENASELGIDPERIAVGGGSAGGGLAAALALLARDRKGPSLFGQMLLCPMLDDRNDSLSMRQMDGLGMWDRPANDVGWAALLGEARGGPDVSPYAAPMRAEDLSGLPPAFLDVGSAEGFRDEVAAYASRLWAAGGRAELHVWEGGFHGYDWTAPEAEISRAARAARMSWLRRLFR